MPSMESKSFHTPEEKRPFVDRGEAQLVALGGNMVLKGRFEPGWHWTEHVGPIAGTDSCQSHHLLYVISGRMRIRMDGETEEREIGPDDVARIEPGHDAWTVSDEACVLVDFAVMPSYAQHAD